jgi:hypothetical protein
MQHHARNHNSNAKNAQPDHPARKAQTAKWDHEARMAKPEHHRHPVNLVLQVPQVPLVTLADPDQPAPTAFPADLEKTEFADAVQTDRKDQQVDQVHQARTASRAVVVLMASRDPPAVVVQLVALANQAHPVAKAHQVVRDCPVTMPPTVRAHRGQPSSSASTKFHHLATTMKYPNTICCAPICARIHSK